ncbi:hypothetical protein [Pseudaminobacter soli (ex Li et al. 2025)]|uniref:hypothetical protein n=1 Tax=Pseudaminobacter soli (ex Li et al. 2025) TaxID=1295366 RepID=UPI0011B1EA16|nr:hypothetical protein [Mesorhizobium soli]
MSTSHPYLSASDLGKIKRVLSGARLPIGGGDEAARFLMRKYQEGVTEEADLAEALERYIELRTDWRLVQGGKQSNRSPGAPER